MNVDPRFSHVLTGPATSGGNRAKCICGLAVASVLMAVPANGLNLLVNGTLDSPGLHESDLADAWTLVEPDVDLGGAPVNSATFAAFGDHTGAGGVGLWYRSFTGGINANSPPAVDAHLYQDVPATPGGAYTLSAWYRMETNYSGLDPAAPTHTVLAMDFLGPGGLIGSVELDIDEVYDVGSFGWQLFSVNGVAPMGTTHLRSRSSMIDGVFSPANPQSAFVDDFTLVPEPASALLLLACGALWRRRAC